MYDNISDLDCTTGGLDQTSIVAKVVAKQECASILILFTRHLEFKSVTVNLNLSCHGKAIAKCHKIMFICVETFVSTK